MAQSAVVSLPAARVIHATPRPSGLTRARTTRAPALGVHSISREPRLNGARQSPPSEPKNTTVSDSAHALAHGDEPGAAMAGGAGMTGGGSPAAAVVNMTA